MLERVGTLNHSNGLLGHYQRIQSRIADTQAQISSGKIGDVFADTGQKAGVLASAKMRAARAEALAAAAGEVEARLSLQDSQLQQLGSLADDLREALGNALATGHGDGLMETARGVYQAAASILNTKIDGVYIYGGTRSDVAPVNATTLDALLAAPAVADVFENSPLAQVQTVEDGVTLETGQLASDLATDLFQMLRDLAAFDAGGSGPFASQLTAAQTSFLTGQAAQIPDVARAVNAQAAENGVRYGQIKDALERHEETQIQLKKFIGDIEDTDMAEAITRLNQEQAQQQAAARMIAQLQDVTLLNFLR
jgi:flagellar hook-associated protein 3 FlgL